MRYPIRGVTRPIGEYRIASIIGLDRIAVDFTGTVQTVPWPKPRAQLGGVDFLTGGLVKFDGNRPVLLSWNTVPSAKSYVITVRRLNPEGAASPTTSVAVLRTADTSIQMPVSMFSNGPFFALTLSATRASADDGADPLFTSAVPNDLITIMSGRFRLSPHCGDFFYDPGEDCDNGGPESSLCNVDCTFSICGDGVRNAADGEARDTAGDTPSCDSNCSLRPVGQ